MKHPRIAITDARNKGTKPYRRLLVLCPVHVGGRNGREHVVGASSKKLGLPGPSYFASGRPHAGGRGNADILLLQDFCIHRDRHRSRRTLHDGVEFQQSGRRRAFHKPVQENCLSGEDLDLNRSGIDTAVAISSIQPSRHSASILSLIRCHIAPAMLLEPPCSAWRLRT